MKFEKITALLHEVDRTGVTEFEIQDGDFRLSIKKTAAAAEGADAGRETAGAVSAKAAPHREEEACRPIPVYGKHKLLAEKACLAEQPDSVILRLTWMYGELTEEERQKGKGNLAVTLRKMLREKRSQSFLP